MHVSGRKGSRAKGGGGKGWGGDVQRRVRDGGRKRDRRGSAGVQELKAYLCSVEGGL